MKRCAECNSLYPDTEQFCELDGTQLIDVMVDANLRGGRSSTAKQSILIIGVAAGLLIPVVLVLIYFALTRERTPENSNQPSATSVAQQPITSEPPRPIPAETASPSVEPSPSPSVEISPSPTSTPPPVQLSSNPISTAAGGKTGPVIIKLDSGVVVEADEAWQTGEGIWYRRHGIVTLVDPVHVKSIEKPPTASPHPTISPSPRPTQ